MGYRACGVPTCTSPKTARGLGLAAWCDDHCDSTIAEPLVRQSELETVSAYTQAKHDAAVRLGSRRWALRAEVDAEIERRHIGFYEGVLDMTPEQRRYERRVWGNGESNGALAKVNHERVMELLYLGLGRQTPPDPHPERWDDHKPRGLRAA